MALNVIMNPSLAIYRQLSNKTHYTDIIRVLISFTQTYGERQPLL